MSLFDAVHQGIGAVHPSPAPVPLQAPHSSHPDVNLGVQPGMTQPLQLHAANKGQLTPLHFAPIQPQMPAVHLASRRGMPVNQLQLVKDGLPAGCCNCHHMSPKPVQSSPHPASSGQQWATDPAGSTQMPSQDTMSAQRGNAMVPTQSPPIFWRLYSQPGPFNMLAQPSAAQSRADAAPNILLPGQTLESVPENGLFLFLQANFQPCFSDSRSVF